MANLGEKQQGIFDFDGGNLDGYENLQREQEERLLTIRQSSGLPVGKWVELTMKGHAGAITGKLELESYPSANAKRDELELKINQLSIKPSFIESCVVLDDQDFD